MLDDASFIQVVANTPLVSIDLIVPDGHGRFLLGHRINRPAKGRWFVPGGRIRKNERLDTAYQRLGHTELGMSDLDRAKARFRGVYEHLYPDNFAATIGISTHYVVLAYELPPTPIALKDLPPEQHAVYRWATSVELLNDEFVHENTKVYFR
jgi:colanic acid biosynthesis protein WcaH